MIVIMMIIASYTNDDDLHHYDYRIVHIVYALAMYDAMLFGDERTDGQGVSRSRIYIYVIFFCTSKICQHRQDLPPDILIMIMIIETAIMIINASLFHDLSFSIVSN